MFKKKTIVICCSAAFYRHANELAEELSKMGYRTNVPLSAKRMKQKKDYDVKKIKVWMNHSELFDLKKKLATDHLDKVAKGDAILIVNDDKPTQPKYIGPNTLMEWGLAYYLDKPIFILNSVSKEHNAYEEVYGMSTTVLNGDLSKIKI